LEVLVPFAELGDVRLFYTDDGVGEPLLLVHGWGSDSHEWCWHLAALAERYRVIAPDLRGHGRTTVPPSGNTPREMAADLAALVERLGAPPLVAIGHSMGAQVVTALAVERPTLVRAVVTIDAGYGVASAAAAYLAELVHALNGDDPAGAAQAIEGWSFNPATPPLIRSWHLRRLAGAPPHVLAQAFAAMFTGPDAFGLRPATEAYLTRRGVPALSFWADPAQAEWEAPLLTHPASRTVSWPGAGHYLHEERPTEFLDELQKWLAELGE
jgi:pimeloyl-ACP methyl ester carboxylesterase